MGLRTFLIVSVFLIVELLLTGTGILLFPLIISLGFFLMAVFACLFIIFSIWLLGKLVLLAPKLCPKGQGWAFGRLKYSPPLLVEALALGNFGF